ncbi:MAG: phosphotransferase [Pseudonocardiaceae bacterium]
MRDSAFSSWPTARPSRPPTRSSSASLREPAATPGAEPPRDTPDITAWLAARGEQWLHLAKPILPVEQRADIRAYLRELTELGPRPLMPCHLDFAPRNLLYGPQRSLGVIELCTHLGTLTAAV